MAASSGAFAAPGDARAKRDSGHRHLPVGALLEHAFGLIDIGVDRRTRRAARNRGRTACGRTTARRRTLPPDRPRRVVPRRGHDVRARARRNHRAAVERPLMRAAVLALGEVALARAAPADRGGVGAHRSQPSRRSQQSNDCATDADQQSKPRDQQCRVAKSPESRFVEPRQPHGSAAQCGSPELQPRHDAQTLDEWRQMIA